MGAKHSTAQQRDTKTREEPPVVVVRGGRRRKTGREDAKNKRRRGRGRELTGGRVKPAFLVGVGVAAAALALGAALARSKSTPAPPSSGDYSDGDETSGSTVVGVGSSGCVFRPALRCDGDESAPSDHVTKLGTLEDSAREWAEVEALKKKIKTIHTWEQYFILPDRTCKPVLNTRNFREHCPNINAVSPDNLRALQVPDGGGTISNFFTSPVEFLPFWNAMKTLLRHGIVPMNNLGIIHRDIKLNNVVYDSSTKIARLIDWDRTVNVEGFDPCKNNFDPLFGLMINLPYAYGFFSAEVQNLLPRDDLSSLGEDTKLNVEILLYANPYQLLLPLECFCYARSGTTTNSSTLGADFAVNARTQVDRIYEMFVSGGTFSNAKYLQLLRTNYDVYGWLTTMVFCFIAFKIYFSDHAEFTFYTAPGVKNVLYKYLYNPEYVCAKYNVEEILSELDKHVKKAT